MSAMDTSLVTSLFLLAAGASAFLHADARPVRLVGLLVVLASLAMGWGRPSALGWQVCVLIASNGMLPLWVAVRLMLLSIVPRHAGKVA